MNEFDILKELEKLNDDIEPGFLSELQQQAPDELHLRIMRAIKLESLRDDEEKAVTQIKTRSRFNYRKYTSITAAAALLLFAVISGAQNMLKNNLTPDSISPKSTMQSNADTSQRKQTSSKLLAEAKTEKSNTPAVKNSNGGKIITTLDSNVKVPSNKQVAKKTIPANSSNKIASKATLKTNNSDNENGVAGVVVQPKSKSLNNQNLAMNTSGNSEINVKKITDLLIPTKILKLSIQQYQTVVTKLVIKLIQQILIH